VNNVHPGPVAGQRGDGRQVPAARQRGSFLMPGRLRGPRRARDC